MGVANASNKSAFRDRQALDGMAWGATVRVDGEQRETRARTEALRVTAYPWLTDNKESPGQRPKISERP